MLIEAVTAGALLVQQPAPLPAAALWLGAALLSVVWLSTVFLQIPAHDQLLGGLDPEVVRRLVVGNWFRTVAWSARALLCLWMIHSVMLNPALAE